MGEDIDRPQRDSRGLQRALWTLAVAFCILGGIAAQALIAPPVDGAGWGVYEIAGFVAAALVVIIAVSKSSRSDA